MISSSRKQCQLAKNPNYTHCVLQNTEFRERRRPENNPVLTGRRAVSRSQFVRNSFIENDMMGLGECCRWLVRENKNVERARSEIVSINERGVVQCFHQFGFKRDEAVELRH